MWTSPVPVPGKRTGLLIRQAGLQAHTKSVNLGAARCSQWTRYIGAQYSACRLTDCVIFPLGLNISKILSERHGGNIQITNNKAGGACVTVKINCNES